MANQSALNQLKDLIASVESINVDKAGDGYNVYNYGTSGNKISTEIIHSFMPREGESNYPIYIFVIKKIS